MSVELRKAKKDDQLSKRRNMAFNEEPVSPLQEQNKVNHFQHMRITKQKLCLQIATEHNYLMSYIICQVTAMNMAEIISGIQNPDPLVQFQSTQAARKLLSRERQPPIDDILKAGVVPQLVAFLACVDR